VTEVVVDYDAEYAAGKTPKGVLNWIAQPKPGQEPARAEARLYADNVRFGTPVVLAMSAGQHVCFGSQPMSLSTSYVCAAPSQADTL
jgi:hypothetical protein